MQYSFPVSLVLLELAIQSGWPKSHERVHSACVFMTFRESAGRQSSIRKTLSLSTNCTSSPAVAVGPGFTGSLASSIPWHGPPCVHSADLSLFDRCAVVVMSFVGMVSTGRALACWIGSFIHQNTSGIRMTVHETPGFTSTFRNRNLCSAVIQVSDFQGICRRHCTAATSECAAESP